jgi:hypothetical protein
MSLKQSLTVEYKDTWLVQSSSAEVFPLLCPVREYDWIDYWSCEMVHSRSGVAEEDCIFRTCFPNQGLMTWVVSRYEPPTAIEFTCMVPDSHVMRLKIALQPGGNATCLHWTRRLISMSEAGDARIAAYTPAAHTAMMSRVNALLVHYLATGTMLQQAPSA